MVERYSPASRLLRVIALAFFVVAAVNVLVDATWTASAALVPFGLAAWVAATLI